ncbi:MAG: hypothetical protein FK734_14660 [Asgard group archaeon]|nr:hypothetical protein [Asgard group archaeon]
MKFYRRKKNSIFLVIILILLNLINSLYIVSGQTNTNEEIPLSRYGHRMVYCTTDENIYLFGGDFTYESEIDLPYLWCLNLETRIWQKMSDTVKPSPRMSHGFVYDHDKNQIILFGGLSTSTYVRLNDLWLYDITTSNWTELSKVIKPAARSDMGIYYDPTIEGVVVFGGYSQYDTKYNDTWIFYTNNQTWIEIDPEIAPSARYGQQMVFDAINQVGLLFAGRDAISYTNDIWIFNATNLTWTQLNPLHTPITRYWHTMTIANERKQLFVFGGRNDDYTESALGTTVVYNISASDCTEYSSMPHPESRFLTAMVYHEELDNLFLFGGTKGFGSIAMGDFWIFNTTEMSWSEIQMNTPTSTNSVMIPVIEVLLPLAILPLIFIRKKR